jgi:hypothetical protein
LFLVELMNLTVTESWHQKALDLEQQKAEMPHEKLMLPVALMWQFVGGSLAEMDADLGELQTEKTVEAYRMVLHSVKEPQTGYQCQSLKPVA